MAERRFTRKQHLLTIADTLERRLGYIRNDPDGHQRNAEDDAAFLRRLATGKRPPIRRCRPSSESK